MEEIKRILFEGTVAERRFLFSFNVHMTTDEIYKKFQIFTRFFYPKFFKNEDAPFHKEMVKRYIGLYQGQSPDSEFLNIGFRGCSKTTYTKLVMVFFLVCDTEHRRKYYKILSEDLKNSKQSATDIYNLIIHPGVTQHFPEIFEKTDTKREETMGSFTTSTGIKVVSGSVGQEQRGHLQEDSRPDLLWFDDIESRNTLRSAVKTRQIWDNMQEAVNGIAHGEGIIVYTCNYISERGNVHLLVERSKNKIIIPIIDDEGNPTWESKYTVDQIESIKNKADDFEGEYLCKPSASKDVLFTREAIDRQIAIKPIKNSVNMKVFKEFNPAHRIAGGQDVALGLGLDSSTSIFIDFDVVPAQVVSTYHDNTIKADDFGDEIARQGQYWGECLVAPENNNAGEATIGRLKQIYPTSRIYAERKKDSDFNGGMPTRLGWNTNTLTKGQMFNDLAKAVDDGLISLNDEDLIREARGYTRNDVMDREIDPRMATRHFDLLTACAIAWQMRHHAVRASKAKYVDPIADLFTQHKQTRQDTWQ